MDGLYGIEAESSEPELAGSTARGLKYAGTLSESFDLFASIATAKRLRTRRRIPSRESNTRRSLRLGSGLAWSGRRSAPLDRLVTESRSRTLLSEMRCRSDRRMALA